MLITLLLATRCFAVDATEELIKKNFAHLEAYYQDLHEHPELSMKETRTAGKVAEEFRRLGLETFELGGGVVGVLKNGKGPVTLVRSELDALPVEENTGLAYKSQNPGVMHACGHDLHTTALVGTAAAMLEQKALWRGTLVFVAQPGEEVVKGAKAMLDAGLLKKIPKLDYAVALHTRGDVPTGMIGFAAGPMMASADSVDVTIRGKGAHGARPDKGIDPIVIAAEFVIKMQTLVGREINPIQPALITVGSIHGGTKHNIIPEEVKLQITVRTYDGDVRNLLIKRIEEIAKGLSKTANAPEPSFAVIESTPPTSSDPAFMARFRDSVIKAIGKDKVTQTEATMGAEDFGLFAKAANVPNLFFWVGADDAKDKTIGNHSPKFAPRYKIVLPLAIRAMTAGLLEVQGSDTRVGER